MRRYFQSRISSSSRRVNGYILPVIIMLSLGVSIVSIVAMRTIVSSSEVLQDQHYKITAQEAAQAGIAAATSCLKKGTTTWANPLRPNTDCAGAAGGGPVYISTNDNWQTSYSVSAPTGTNPLVVTSVGTSTLRTSAGAALKTYSVTLKGQVGQVTTNGAAKNVTSVAASATHGCAIANTPSATDSAVSCWGYNRCGQNGNSVGGTTCLGLPASRIDRYPTAANAGSALTGKIVTSITTNSYASVRPHTCAIAYTASPADAKAYCWGQVPPNGTDYGTVPTQVGGPLASMTVTAISSGSDHACAIAHPSGNSSQPQLYCWGWNTNYATGTGGSYTATYSTPTAISGGDLAGKKPISVSAGFRYTCAVAYTTTPADARAYCWGRNNMGQLGVGNTTDQTTPKAVVLANRVFTSISAGSNFEPEDDGVTDTPYPTTCGITYPTGGTVAQSAAYCWGYHGNGTVGDGSTSPLTRTSPVAVSAGAGAALNAKIVTNISVGGRQACAIAYPTSGTVAQSGLYCWGSNVWRAIGDGSGPTTIRQSPVAITGGALSGKIPTSISTGGSVTCVGAYATSNATDGRAYCWGSNYNTNAIGTGASPTPDYYTIPQEVNVSSNSSLGPVTTTTYGSPIIY